MKRIPATSYSLKKSRQRVVPLIFAVILSVGTVVSYTQLAHADQWDSQISSLQNKANQYKKQAEAFRKKADTLQNKLNQINAEISALQAEIKVNNTKHEKLQADIAANTKKLNQTKDALGSIVANLYVSSDISSLEMVASSSNISDFIDQAEYKNTVRDQLATSLEQIKKIQAQLESDNAAVEKILAQLKVQHTQLEASRADQQNLVNQTRGQEAAYRKLVSKSKQQIQNALDAQRAYYNSLGGGVDSGVVGTFQYWGWSGNQGCGGDGYPYCGPQDSMIDPWQLYNRECVSYAAWAISHRFNRQVYGFHGQGNAYEWPHSAAVYSGAYRVYSPQPGDAVVLPAMSGFAPIGHLMVVEKVSGSDVFVSQYNFYGTGQYSTMWIKTSGVIFMRFPPA